MVSERGAEALEELRIRFRPLGADRYLVLANGPAAAADVIEWRPAFSYAVKLDELFSEAFGQTVRSAAGPIDSRLTELGRELFGALLPGPIRDCIEASKGIAEVEGCELRLRFDLPATLSDLPVEILCPPLDDKIGRALALNASLSVVRSVRVTPRTPRLPGPEDAWEPLSILVVVASPRGWPPLDVSAELDLLKEKLMGFTASEGVVLEVLGGPDNDDRATLAELANRVRWRGNPLAVLLIAHGETSRDHGQACVILEDDKGSAHRIPADRLAGTLGNSQRVRLVVLNLCVGAKVVSGEPLSGVAQAVISNGIPAVVGMSTAVTDEAASRFTAPLFRALCDNETIDEAVQLARHQMEAVQADTRIEWCAPVLCMEDGCSRGQLFKVISDEPDDPLREGLEATKRLKNSPALANLVPAALFRRAMGDWDRVRGLAVRGQDNTRAKQYQALFKRLEHEACIELAIHQIDELCLSLASDPPKTELVLPDLRRVPRPIVERLKVEIARANERRRFHEHYTEGMAAERNKDWAAALKQLAIFRDRSYRDGRHRLAYATGRLADDEERWADARDAYLEIGDGLPNSDVGRRLTYAHGRVSESEDEWPQAADAYAALRAGYRDRDQRLPYARGRSAEQAGDCSGAVSAFDLCPDTYRDVACRRGYAKARVAESQNAWTAVIEALADLDIGCYDGEAGRLHSYAEARVAEDDGCWDRAAEIYEIIGAGERDVATRWPYALGRAAQDRSDWTAAVEAYQQLPGDYRDVTVRCAYVTARHAETLGQWTTAIHAYQAIPEHPHTIERLPYAQACLAASTPDWSGVIEALAGADQMAEDLHEVAGLLGGYARGRVAEAAGHWVTAAQDYQACGQFRDAPARAEYMAGRDRADNADWAEALAAYESVARDLTEAQQAADRLTELRDALPWVDGLPRWGFAADPATPTDLASPYQTLRVAGITPSSTAQEVKDASFVLMASGLWTPEVRMAWDRLRSVPERLAVDALLYRLIDGSTLSHAQRELDGGSPGELLARLQGQLDLDAPLFALLSGQRAAAIAEWERRLRNDLTASGVAHALAVAWTWYAIERGNAAQHEDAARGWERAIAYWGRVLGDDAYWASWRSQRASCYQFAVSTADLSRARRAVVDTLSERLAEMAGQSRRDGQADQVHRYDRLRLALAVEMAAGRALAATGGIVGDTPLTARACGPLFLGLHPELRAPLGQLVARLDAAGGALDGEHAAGFRLRCAFSELGEAIVLLEQNRPDRAVAALRGLHQIGFKDLPADCGHELSAEPTGCAECAEFAERNPGHAGLPHRRTRLLQDAVDLATRAFLSQAQAALAERRSGVDTALHHWRAAIEIAANVGGSVRIKHAIVPVALGRADALRDENWGTRFADERLTEAIEFLAATRALVGGVDDGQLTAKEAELLTSRGVWRGYWCYQYDEPSFERGVDDLRLALTLNPESLDTRDNLAYGLIYWAQGIHHQSHAGERLLMLGEALTVIHEGLLRTPRYVVFGVTLGAILAELEQWCFDELSDEELDRRLRDRSTDPVAEGLTKAEQLIRKAENELEEHPEAGLLNLIAAVRSDAGTAVRARLGEAVNQLSERAEWSQEC